MSAHQSSPVENGSYSPRPPHSPTISPARGHNQASDNEVSFEISFLIAKCNFFQTHFEDRRFDITVRFYIR